MAHIHFFGGVGEVTGANFLLETDHASILVDCGLLQGGEFSPERNCHAFSYDPTKVDALLVTHAHADHIGRIPKLVRDGFSGPIYTTPPTRDLMEVMLQDAYRVMRSEAENRGYATCYEEGDVASTLHLVVTHGYHEPFELPDGIQAEFTDAGHILGSAMVTLTRNGKKFLFTGDIGNNPQPLLSPPEVVKDYDYILMESVYGDRVHEDVKERSDILLSYIKDTIQKRGTLIIPAFSLERTQGMLFEINNFVEEKKINPIPVYLDSPLAIKVTDIYRKYTKYLRPEIQDQIGGGDDIFDFPKFHQTETVQESSQILRTPGPKIIIAGSGMSHGGRILSHEKHLLEDPKTTLLLVGYQTVGSIGRILQDGGKRVRIDGKDVKVRARIGKIRGYSGHADRDQLVEFVHAGGEKAKQVFVAMGEERASLFLVQRLRDYLGVNAVAPHPEESIEVDF
jgi:metallo-beta-lactamase family protein